MLCKFYVWYKETIHSYWIIAVNTILPKRKPTCGDTTHNQMQCMQPQQTHNFDSNACNPNKHTILIAMNAVTKNIFRKKKGTYTVVYSVCSRLLKTDSSVEVLIMHSELG